MFTQLSSIVRPAAMAALFGLALIGSNAQARDWDDHGRGHYGYRDHDRGDWRRDHRDWDHNRHYRGYYNVYPNYGWTGGYLTPGGYYDGYGYSSVYGYYGAYYPRRHCVTYSDRHGRYTVCD